MGYYLKHLKLLKTYARLGFKKSHEYRFQFFTNILTYIILAFVWFILWELLFADIGAFAHWTKPMLFLLVSFMIFNDAVWQFAFFTQGLSADIIEGRLDAYMVRPINPLFGMLMRHFQMNALPPFLIGLGLIIFVTASFFSLALLKMAIALMISVLAVAIVHVGTICIGLLAFWFGRVRVLLSLYRAFMVSKSYPLDILGGMWRSVLTFFFPALFMGTFPALAISSWSLQTGLLVLLFAFVVLLIWWVIMAILWRYGVRRYESMGG